MKSTPLAATHVLPQKQRASLRGHERYSRREVLVAWAFVSPALLGFLAFYLYPTIRGIYLSLTSYDLLSSPQFIGFANYIRMASDPLFWNSVVVTVEYVVINIGVQTFVALALAVLMQRLTKSVVIRGTLLLPFLVSNVIAALVWFWLLDYQIGLVNQVMVSLGLNRIAFFNDPTWGIITIALVNVWRYMGYTALLIFAGLQAIPGYVYEAATIDGCSEWRAFWRITMPLLRPVLALVMITSITGSFQIFDTVAVTTQGGPINATRVMQYYIYQQGFGNYEFGYANALSVVLMIILAAIAFIQLRLFRADQSDLA